MMGNHKLYALAALLATAPACTEAQAQDARQMEKLSRGVVVVPAKEVDGRSNGNFISWRLLGTDSPNTVFDVLRDGTAITRNLAGKTNYADLGGSSTNKYSIVTKVNGEPVDTSEAVSPWAELYTTLRLDRPDGGTTPDNVDYTYSPNDCSVGDVDGDGEYEIFVKWDPSNSQDNAHNGYTGNVIIDCYKLDGTKLWRVDLGPNIRAGAHYTQFLVYDFDGDGRAEMICKTAPGSTDSRNYFVSAAATDQTLRDHVDNYKDYRGSDGRVSRGPEYLTVFNGLTGEAIHTVYYNPNRRRTLGEASDGYADWGDTWGNRGDRHLACVAWLDGPEGRPSAVMCRGYYAQAYLWAVGFDGKELTTKWLHASTSQTKVTVTNADGTSHDYSYSKNTRADNGGSKTAYGNGNHNISVADVDGDGRDEIIYGACAIDDDGRLLYATGYGHGDAIHVSDLIPSRPGLEVFDVHEGETGWDLHDAATGEILRSWKGGGDNGRGMAADIDAQNDGFEFWSASDATVRSCTSGASLGANGPSTNFRAYWDGDLQDELLDGGKMDKWNTGRIYPLEGKNFNDLGASCNGTKATPNLLADIIGDWREEVVLHTDTSLVIVTSNVETDYRVPTLMHNHVYRMGVAWQNVAYNQPPHLGYYLPTSIKTQYVGLAAGAMEQTVALGDSIVPLKYVWINCGTPKLLKSIAPDGTETEGNAMDGFTFTRSTLGSSRSIALEGAPSQTGDYLFILQSGANVVTGEVSNDTIRIHCVKATGISDAAEAASLDFVSLKGNAITDRLTLGFNLDKAQSVSVSIYNAAGARVFGSSYDVAGSSELTIGGLGHLAPGIYILNVETAGGRCAKKIAKM